MSAKLKSVFFILLALYVTIPLVGVYIFLDPIPSFVFLSMPLLYLLLALVGWKETAHICFRVILFFVLVINTVILYHYFFYENYIDPQAAIVDHLPIRLVLHGLITGIIITIVILTLLIFKIGKIPRGERSVMGIFTLVLFALSLKNLMFS